MRLLHKNQRGFTLIELMIAIGITGLIASGIVTAIFQVFNVSTLSNNHMLALRQVQNAGYWISHDTQMALPQSIDAVSDDIDNGVDPDDPGDDHPLYNPSGGFYNGQKQVLYLSWVGWQYPYGGGKTYTDTYEVYYTYDYDSVSGSGKLWRYQKITRAVYESGGSLAGSQPDPQESTTFIADYITSMAEDDIDMAGGKLVVTITAAIGDAEEIRTYEITPRPSSQ